jgi:CheY-like chemotaxis protein
MRETTILLVEDNEDHAELIRRMFERNRSVRRVCRVADGEAALDYLFRRGTFADPEASPRPDLVLLDLRMPRVDGLEVLRQIKDSTALRDIAVVVVTSSESERDVLSAYARQARSYLVKPLDQETLDRLLEDLEPCREEETQCV